MENPLLAINGGQRCRWTTFGIEDSVLIGVISRITTTELQTRGMTIFKSFWIKTSYHVNDTVHHFLNGILDINMHNALARFLHQKITHVDLEELTPSH